MDGWPACLDALGYHVLTYDARRFQIQSSEADVIRGGRFFKQPHRQDAITAAALILIFGLALILRLYQLDDKPADVYKDIVIIFQYLQDILALRWPVYFNDSAGPLYHYLITPVVLAFGLNYLALKIASVLVSLGTLVAVYLLARELLPDRLVALLGVLLTAVSSWLLVFSRLGNSQILTPLLACLAFYFLARALRSGTRRDIFWTALCADLGLYVYPQSFFIPPAVAVALAWFCWRRKLPWRAMGTYLIWTAIFAWPFAYIVLSDPSVFFGGYIGDHILSDSPLSRLSTWPGLVLASLLMLNVKGDVVFRSNPVQLPHLDVLSGLFFLIGLVYLLLKRDARLFFLLIWPALFLQLPSTLVLNYPGEVPSASRTLLIVPFVCLIAAAGLAWVLRLLPAWWQRALLLFAIGGLILTLNVNRYFNIYINQLPNRNASFSRLTAAAIDRAPAATHITVYGCCWGEWSSPEWDDITYALARPRDVRFVEPEAFDCASVTEDPGPQLLIVPPDDVELQRAISECIPHIRMVLATGPHGEHVYGAYTVPARNEAAATAGP
jgi:hypothetical protein